MAAKADVCWEQDGRHVLRRLEPRWPPVAEAKMAAGSVPTESKMATGGSDRWGQDGQHGRDEEEAAEMRLRQDGRQAWHPLGARWPLGLTSQGSRWPPLLTSLHSKWLPALTSLHSRWLLVLRHTGSKMATTSDVMWFKMATTSDITAFKIAASPNAYWEQDVCHL